MILAEGFGRGRALSLLRGGTGGEERAQVVAVRASHLQDELERRERAHTRTHARTHTHTHTRTHARTGTHGHARTALEG